VLKYTLGALAGAVLILVAGFAVLTFAIGDSGAEPAYLVIVSVDDQGRSPGEFEVEAGRIIELRFHNESSTPRSLRLVSDDVEQLPKAPAGDGDGVAYSIEPGITIDAQPHQAETALVRFKKEGEYALAIGTPGVWFPPLEVIVTVR
jgi:hypothetical protein